MRGQRAHRGLQILVRKSFGIRVREKPESGCVKKMNLMLREKSAAQK